MESIIIFFIKTKIMYMQENLSQHSYIEVIIIYIAALPSLKLSYNNVFITSYSLVFLSNTSHSLSGQSAQSQTSSQNPVIFQGNICFLYHLFRFYLCFTHEDTNYYDTVLFLGANRYCFFWHFLKICSCPNIFKSPLLI